MLPSAKGKPLFLFPSLCTVQYVVERQTNCKRMCASGATKRSSKVREGTCTTIQPRIYIRLSIILTRRVRVRESERVREREREREREKWGISLLLYSTKKESGKVCRLVEKKYISQERERENGDVHVTVVAFVFVFIIIMDLYYETSTVTNSSFYNDANCYFYFQKYSYLHQY